MGSPEQPGRLVIAHEVPELIELQEQLIEWAMRLGITAHEPEVPLVHQVSAKAIDLATDQAPTPMNEEWLERILQTFRVEGKARAEGTEIILTHLTITPEGITGRLINPGGLRSTSALVQERRALMAELGLRTRSAKRQRQLTVITFEDSESLAQKSLDHTTRPDTPYTLGLLTVARTCFFDPHIE